MTGIEQNMLQGNDWADLFHNISNKQDLIALFASYLKSESSVSRNIPVYFNKKDESWCVRQGIPSRLADCNHEEADTKMMVFALREDTDVVIVARDTDVLILMIYIYAKRKITSNLYMKYAAGKYANIGKIVEYLGIDLSLKLVHIHAVTGCDTTSYFYGVGKMKVLNKCKKEPKLLSLLNDLGAADGLPAQYKDIVEFIRTACYAGTRGESLVETRVRLYQKQKVKTSQSLPPDPDSMKQAVLRINHQLFYWTRADILQTPTIALNGNGWTTENNKVNPVWFTGKSTSIMIFCQQN